MASTQQALQKYVAKYGSDYRNIQTVRLGKLDGATVNSDVPGILWARQWNGREIKVHNKALVASTFDLRVLVGVKRTNPTKWVILETVEDYLTPAAGGNIAAHHLQHEFGGTDVVWVDRKQILAHTLVVSNSLTWKVYLYGGVFHSLTAITMVPSQELNLSSYVASSGAYYLGIEVDDTGTLFYHAGSNFGAPDAGNYTYIPTPPPGRYLIGYVMFYEGQAQLLDEHIRVMMPLGIIPKVGGLQIHEATADIPQDTDEWGFWDVADNLTKKISHRDLLLLIQNWVSSAIHTHGLTRWNGAPGQTVFELPDIAESVQSVLLNGLEEDPFVYSLSSDGTQIILDNALTSATTVMARYIIRKA